ncbi:hypothetical protein FRC04_004474 [Tulasnella sp. 424]|nr:hypothetical protein FRC04_004474 [Tulasnella sp. 424]KAG8967481.1 hypothetical protein FRC05_002076 [Tulasnella sp. 425]
MASTSEHDALAANFASDPRIYFNKVTGRWQFEDDDEKEMEYDTATGTWVQVIDDDLLKAQQAAYKMEGVDDDAVAAPVLRREAKKRKDNPMDVDTMEGSVAKKSKSKKPDRFNGSTTAEVPNPPARRSKNTAVYVSRLPPDVTVDELRDAFSKFGLIEIDDRDEPKIKLYADPQGNFNGEALVVYFKEESVDLAIRMLDDAELRLGEPGSRMAVRKAEFGHKEKDGEEGAKAEYKPRTALDKKKATRRIGKMQSKLNDWDDEDGFGPPSEAPETASSLALKARVVVLKHMFTLNDLEQDPTLILELKNDVREECETLGDVTNVVLYDLEPEGVMTVKFRDSVSAQACIMKMNGRFFDGRKVSAALYTGRERFKKTGGGNDLLGEEDETEKKRLDAFASWLEGNES